MNNGKNWDIQLKNPEQKNGLEICLNFLDCFHVSKYNTMSVSGVNTLGCYNMQTKLRIEGSIFGCLTGNALGSRCLNKKLTSITVSQQLARYYSEAGAMSLCTMESLIESELIDTEDIASRFNEWYIGSHLAATEKVESRINVSQALRIYINGMPPDRCGSKEIPADNSALMRMLPIALWNAHESVGTIVKSAHEVSRFTNQQVEAQVCSALYCLLIRRFLLEHTDKVSDLLTAFYAEEGMKEHAKALSDFQEVCSISESEGESYVFDSLWTASSIFANNRDFEKAVTKAIVLGNDCEVSGYLVGSLAGTALGINEIPQRWLNQLELSDEAKNIIENFVRIIVKRN
jgi:ADP-ribosylglycohydrolase